MPQPSASATRLGDMALAILQDPERQREMADAMGRLARPNATEAIVNELAAIARHRKG